MANVFIDAYRLRRFDLFRELRIIGLEAPILEERKRGPTRHPKDLEAYVKSINSALGDASAQVVTQARILFSSPRFADQNLVVLFATSAEFYRITVLGRDHPAIHKIPSDFELNCLIDGKGEDAADLGGDSEDSFSGLVQASRIQSEKQEMEKALKDRLREQDHKAREQRATAREARKADLSTLDGQDRQRSEFVLNAIYPYSDTAIEGNFSRSSLPRRSIHKTNSFEPLPLSHESIFSLAELRNPSNGEEWLSSLVSFVSSEKIFQMIRRYLAGLAAAERARRT